MPGWMCQFEKPTMKQLIDDLEPEMGKLVAQLRKNLLRSLKKKPTLEWLGLTLRWCESTTPQAGSKLLSVHIVPDPSMARVALTVSTIFFDEHPPAILSKALHRGLEVATTIGHQTWIEFPLSSIEHVEAIEAFIELVHQA